MTVPVLTTKATTDVVLQSKAWREGNSLRENHLFEQKQSIIDLENPRVSLQHCAVNLVGC